MIETNTITMSTKTHVFICLFSTCNLVRPTTYITSDTNWKFKRGGGLRKLSNKTGFETPDFNPSVISVFASKEKFKELKIRFSNRDITKADKSLFPIIKQWLKHVKCQRVKRQKIAVNTTVSTCDRLGFFWGGDEGFTCPDILVATPICHTSPKPCRCLLETNKISITIDQ